jgi:hypothetical protein
MKMRRRVVGPAILLLTLWLLAACVEGTVAKQRHFGSERIPQVLVVTDSGKERWQDVTELQLSDCTVGAAYPECKTGAYGGPGGGPEVGGNDEQEQQEAREKAREDGCTDHRVSYHAAGSPYDMATVTTKLTGQEDKRVNKMLGSFNSERTICLADGETAVAELVVITELVGDRGYPRHMECEIRVDGVVAGHPMSADNTTECLTSAVVS